MARDSDDPTSLTWHLVPQEEWRSAPMDAPYLPAAFQGDGFIHTTHAADEVAAAGNRYYRDDSRPYLTVLIDLQRVTSSWRYDGDRRFPHIYGPLNRDAVIAVHPAPRTSDGTFLAPEETGS
jgi:uncharacterized protein (DUF952 family)